MRLRVCGCAGGETRDHALTGFVVDDRIGLDAGSLARALTLDEQCALEHVLLSHSHLDHSRDVASIAINRLGLQPRTLEVWANHECAGALRTHLLAEPLWVDVTRLPSPEQPCLRLHELADEQWHSLGAHDVLAVRTHHAVPGSAFLLRGPRGILAYSGDTGPTDRLWHVLAAQRDVRALILEVSFPDELQGVADASQHLTPATAARELRKLPDRGFPVLFTHVKPGHEAAVRVQVERERIPACRFLAQGEVVEL